MASLPPTNDTIVAIASAPGVGAIGVVRLSGPDAFELADGIFDPHRGSRVLERPAGRAVYGRLLDGGAVLDEAVLLTFRAPHSYTSQDVIELQTHGGPAVLRATLDLCLSRGARLAGPGEFTLRAYLSGRLDLLQAESVLELVNAQSDTARRNAALGLTGALSERLGTVQSHLVRAYAGLQAAFDYPDEGVPEQELAEPLREAAGAVDELLATAEAGRLSRQGARLALLGRPNAGKSSLLNALLGYERSIVSSTPGTTRDYLEAQLVLGGVPITAVDTAGIREIAEDGDQIEASGVAQSRRIGLHADMRLVVIDGSAPLHPDDLALLTELPSERTIVALNKRDRPAAFGADEIPATHGSVVEVSATTGAGVELLRDAVADSLVGSASTAELWLTQERHVAALERVRAALQRAAELEALGEIGLIALELQDAVGALGEVTGRQDVTEETLASIFARFCVGK